MDQTQKDLSLLEVTGKDSRISFDHVRTDIPFTLLFFYYLRSLFYSTLCRGK